MGQELFANNANTTLGSNLAAGVTTIVLQSGAGALFPSPTGGDFFRVSLNDAATGLVWEICYCTARAGDNLTVTRAQEGTVSPALWLTGDLIGNQVTAGAMENLVQSGGALTNLGYAVDTGTVNLIAANVPADPTAYAAGQVIDVLVANTTTGAAFLNVGGLGAIPIHYRGSPLGTVPAVAQLIGGIIYSFIYNPDTPSFDVIAGPTTLSVPVYAPDTGAINALVATFVPALLAYFSGLALNVKVLNTNTASATININGLGAKTITWNGAVVPAGALVAGQIYTLVYDGTNFQLTSPPALAVLIGRIAQFQDQEAGSSPDTIGGTMGQRTLNTTIVNNIPGCSLAGNEVTLLAGTYEFDASAAAEVTSGSTGFQSQLVGTIAGVLNVSPIGFAAVATNGVITWSGIFTLPGTDTVYLESAVSGAGGNGGQAFTFTGAGAKVYVNLVIRQIG